MMRRRMKLGCACVGVVVALILLYPYHAAHPPHAAAPHKNLYFVKIHRAGSGTLHNVLLRFALNHCAFLALNDLRWSDLFPRTASEAVLLPPPTHPNFTGYNMWIDHARFSAAAGSSFLPNDTLYVTQLREPFSHATASYKKLIDQFHAHRLSSVPYSAFMKNPDKYEPLAIQHHGTFTFSLSRNVMAAELGYGHAIRNNVSDFQVYLEFLNKQFSHVNILEDLPASLVLLKRKLHWELKDVLMVPIHVHSKNRTQPPQSEIEKHRQWSSLDYALYDYFLARHKREVAEQGAEFQEEVNTLIVIQNNFTRFCDESYANFREKRVTDVGSVREMGKYSLTIGETRFSKAFNVTYVDCASLSAAEQEMKTMYKYRMYPAVCEKDPQLANKLRLNCSPKEYDAVNI